MKTRLTFGQRAQAAEEHPHLRRKKKNEKSVTYYSVNTRHLELPFDYCSSLWLCILHAQSLHGFKQHDGGAEHKDIYRKKTWELWENVRVSIWWEKGQKHNIIRGCTLYAHKIRYLREFYFTVLQCNTSVVHWAKWKGRAEERCSRMSDNSWEPTNLKGDW